MTISVTIADWLPTTMHGSKSAGYVHCLIKENFDNRTYVFDQFKAYVDAAHEDARRFWLDATVSLDPLEGEETIQSSGYPALLPMQTLKGYFGEVFAALFAEYFAPFGEDKWKVPAHLFRWHNAAFEYLESIRQGGRKLQSVVGRTGDDCLAFQLDDLGNITKILYCEAKCTKNHSTEMIKEAHEKAGISQVASLTHLISLLSLRSTSDAKIWVDSLRKIRLNIQSQVERYDLVSYVCGQHPKQSETWISPGQPHVSYKGRRPLQVVEAHLRNVDELVRAVYCKVDDGADDTNS